MGIFNIFNKIKLKLSGADEIQIMEEAKKSLPRKEYLTWLENKLENLDKEISERMTVGREVVSLQKERFEILSEIEKTKRGLE